MIGKKARPWLSVTHWPIWALSALWQSKTNFETKTKEQFKFVTVLFLKRNTFSSLLKVVPGPIFVLILWHLVSSCELCHCQSFTTLNICIWKFVSSFHDASFVGNHVNTLRNCFKCSLILNSIWTWWKKT